MNNRKQAKERASSYAGNIIDTNVRPDFQTIDRLNAITQRKTYKKATQPRKRKYSVDYKKENQE